MKKKPFSMHVDLDAFNPASDSDKEYLVKMRPASTFFRDGVKRLLKNKIATISFFLIVVLALTSIFLPFFWPYAYEEMLGMDDVGRMDSSYGNISPFSYGGTELERMHGKANLHQIFIPTNKAYLEELSFETVSDSEGLAVATAALETAEAELEALEAEGSGATEEDIAAAGLAVERLELIVDAEKAVNSAATAKNELAAVIAATKAAAEKAGTLGLSDKDIEVITEAVSEAEAAVAGVDTAAADAAAARDAALVAADIEAVTASAEAAEAASKSAKALVSDCTESSEIARQLVFHVESAAVADSILAKVNGATADTYAEISASLTAGAAYTHLEGAKYKDFSDAPALSKWIWDHSFFSGAKRNAGDSAVFETETGYYVVSFEGFEGGGEFIFPHLFGTDAHGRDYFIRVVYGMRVSLAVGLFASIIVLIIGMLVGSVSGYLGGKVDLIIMRIVDIIYSLPDMLMVILLASVLKLVLGDVIEGTFLEKIGSNIISLFIVFALLYWVSMARLIRGQILSLREQEYVLSARISGAKSGRIITKHLVPNCISVIIISTALQIPSAIFTESYLSFLGLGVNAPMPSLGSLASDALNGYATYPYRLILPAVVISLIVLSLNLFGDGLRDAFDPKLNK